MIINKGIKGIKIVLMNYQKLVQKSILFLIYIMSIITISIIITFPIWFTATKYSKLYSLSIIFILLSFIIISFTKKLHKWIVSKKESGLSTVKIFLIPVKKIVLFLIFIFLFYLILFLFSKKLLLFPIILSLGYLFALGSYIFIYRKKNAHIFS